LQHGPPHPRPTLLLLLLEGKKCHGLRRREGAAAVVVVAAAAGQGSGSGVGRWSSLGRRLP
jgi:hypothetical protein